MSPIGHMVTGALVVLLIGSLIAYWRVCRAERKADEAEYQKRRRAS